MPSPAASAEKINTWMERAAADGVNVVAFPEVALCGYAAMPEYWQTAARLAFAAAEAQIAAAGHLNLAVVLGTTHWEGGAAVGAAPFNGLLLIDQDGRVKERYSKTHLAKRWPVPGRSLLVVELARVPSCFIVCHDVRYPELVRLPAVAGAQICYYCSNESGLLQDYKLAAYQAMPVARATENGIFVVMANAPADAADLQSPAQSHGNSKIVHPDGNVLFEAHHVEERLVAATIQVDDATRAYALRATNDETVLRTWIRQGAGLVERVG